MLLLARFRLGAIGLALVASAANAAAAGLQIPLPDADAHASAEVFFSPGADSDRAVAAAIAAARSRVWIAGYYFTSSVVAKSLAKANERKVDVRVLLDRSQATLRYSSASNFHNHDVPLSINAPYPVMHHKFVVIADAMVGFGSMNFTRAGAQSNAENFNLFRRWPQLAQTYAREFERLEAESERYRPGMTFEAGASPGEKAE